MASHFFAQLGHIFALTDLHIIIHKPHEVIDFLCWLQQLIIFASFYADVWIRYVAWVSCMSKQAGSHSV